MVSVAIITNRGGSGLLKNLAVASNGVFLKPAFGDAATQELRSWIGVDFGAQKFKERLITPQVPFAGADEG